VAPEKTVKTRAARAAGDASATRLNAVAHSLLQGFRRQRPLRGGSLLITMFGDAIAPRGGTITLGSLIQLAEPFGLTERLVRTSVARLAQEDWLTAHRDGRLSEYSLSDNGRTRFAEATHRIYGASPGVWPGRWTLVFVPAAAGAAREKLRERLRWLGFGETAPGVFAHPMLEAADLRKALRSVAGAAEQPIILEARSVSADSDHQMVRAGWNLEDLETRYRQFVKTYEPVSEALGSRAATDPANAFAIRTLLIHEYRKVHLRDPMLPEGLLPSGWIGATAYELCRELYASVFNAAEEHLSQLGARLDGRLTAPAAETFARFGGLAPR